MFGTISLGHFGWGRRVRREFGMREKGSEGERRKEGREREREKKKKEENNKRLKMVLSVFTDTFFVQSFCLPVYCRPIAYKTWVSLVVFSF